MRSMWCAVVFAGVLASVCCGEVRFRKDCAAVFASEEEGKKLLMTRDEYIERLSPFDRLCRMNTDTDVPQKAYLEFIGRSVLAWNEQEIQKVTKAVRSIGSRLGSFSFAFPKVVYLVKTSGIEEGGAAYTRGNGIFLPLDMLRGSDKQLAELICHELFHVLSRHNPALRDRLYQVIGFETCNEIKLPETLAARKITNPDAPKLDCRIRVKHDEQEIWTVPFLCSRTQSYDPNESGNFFYYLQFKLLAVEQATDANDFTVVLHDGDPVLLDAEAVAGYFEQIGYNTHYIIHPEEILADNFVILVYGKIDAPSTEILGRISEVIAE
ncbi:MAG: hypothetical protein ABFD91_12565 [Anaerohalosphaeraceae bacterium]